MRRTRRTIIVTTPPNDGNRVTDTVVLEAHFGPAGLDAMVGQRWTSTCWTSICFLAPTTSRSGEG